LHVCIREEAG